MNMKIVYTYSVRKDFTLIALMAVGAFLIMV